MLGVYQHSPALPPLPGPALAGVLPAEPAWGGGGEIKGEKPSKFGGEMVGLLLLDSVQHSLIEGVWVMLEGTPGAGAQGDMG